MGPLVLSITLRPYSHSACSSSVYYYCPSCLRCGCFSSRLASCCVSARSIVALGTVGALQCARAVPGVRLGVGFWLFRLLEAASRVGLWRSGGGIEGFGFGVGACVSLLESVGVGAACEAVFFGSGGGGGGSRGQPNSNIYTSAPQGLGFISVQPSGHVWDSCD